MRAHFAEAFCFTNAQLWDVQHRSPEAGLGQPRSLCLYQHPYTASSAYLAWLELLTAVTTEKMCLNIAHVYRFRLFFVNIEIKGKSCTCSLSSQWMQEQFIAWSVKFFVLFCYLARTHTDSSA